MTAEHGEAVSDKPVSLRGTTPAWFVSLCRKPWPIFYSFLHFVSSYVKLPPHGRSLAHTFQFVIHWISHYSTLCSVSYRQLLLWVPPWSWIIPVAQLYIRISISFYGSRSFVTVFTRDLHLFLSWVRLIQSIPHLSISQRSISEYSSHFKMRLSCWLCDCVSPIIFRLLYCSCSIKEMQAIASSQKVFQYSSYLSIYLQVFLMASFRLVLTPEPCMNSSPPCMLHALSTLSSLYRSLTLCLAKITNYVVPHFAVFSSFGRNIFLNTLIWNTYSLCLPLNTIDQASHPHISTGILQFCRHVYIQTAN